MRLSVGLVATTVLLWPSSSLAGNPWYWNHQAAEYSLLTQGISYRGNRLEVAKATCYGLGKFIWGSKGKEFQRFHCSITPSAVNGNAVTFQARPFGFTFVVDGRYAWNGVDGAGNKFG